MSLLYDTSLQGYIQHDALAYAWNVVAKTREYIENCMLN